MGVFPARGNLCQRMKDIPFQARCLGTPSNRRFDESLPVALSFLTLPPPAALVSFASQ
jgi:hypothetical protein